MRSIAVACGALVAWSCAAKDAPPPAAPVTGEVAPPDESPAARGDDAGAIRGPADDGGTAHLARQQALLEASQQGIIGLLQSSGSDPDASTTQLGDDDDGLGLGGLGSADAGAQIHGAPRDMHEGPIAISGRLPPEVIQRVVRQHLGALRACYLAGLQRNPSLAGRVAVRFVIDGQGNVASAADSGSDLPDPTVVQCILGVFPTLSFPMPEGGTVTVSYPFVFHPG